jgi:uncharacterized protein YcnI
MKPVTQVLFAAAIGLCAAAAQSHVVLQDPAAAAGASYRAAFLVSHGCAGSPTTAIRVRIPEGFEGAKPMPKPGWTLRSRSDRLQRPYDSHGKTVTEDVVELSWTANGPDNALPEAWYDEFVLRGSTPHQPGALWFQVLQVCEKGQIDWAQVPASGTSTQGLKAPAALLEVLDTGNAGGHQH